MSAIITEKFRKHNANQFHESFSESSANVYYLFIGKATAFTSSTTTGSDSSPPTPREMQLEKHTSTHGTRCWRKENYLI